MLYLVLSFFLICVDQLSKFLISDFFSFGQRYPVISGFFYLTNISNKGAAWGMFQGGKWFFIALTVVTIVVMIFMFVRIKRFSFRFPMVLIASGGIGNMIDRLFKPDGVLDFLEFHFGSYVFPVFNFADICITVGAAILILVLLFSREEKEEADDSEKSEDDAYALAEEDDDGDCYFDEVEN